MNVAKRALQRMAVVQRIPATDGKKTIDRTRADRHGIDRVSAILCPLVEAERVVRSCRLHHCFAVAAEEQLGHVADTLANATL